MDRFQWCTHSNCNQNCQQYYQSPHNQHTHHSHGHVHQNMHSQPSECKHEHMHGPVHQHMHGQNQQYGTCHFSNAHNMNMPPKPMRNTTRQQCDGYSSSSQCNGAFIGYNSTQNHYNHENQYKQHNNHSALNRAPFTDVTGTNMYQKQAQIPQKSEYKSIAAITEIEIHQVPGLWISYNADKCRFLLSNCCGPNYKFFNCENIANILDTKHWEYFSEFNDEDVEQLSTLLGCEQRSKYILKGLLQRISNQITEFKKHKTNKIRKNAMYLDDNIDKVKDEQSDESNDETGAETEESEENGIDVSDMKKINKTKQLIRKCIKSTGKCTQSVFDKYLSEKHPNYEFCGLYHHYVALNYLNELNCPWKGEWFFVPWGKMRSGEKNCRLKFAAKKSKKKLKKSKCKIIKPSKKRRRSNTNQVIETANDDTDNDEDSDYSEPRQSQKQQPTNNDKNTDESEHESDVDMQNKEKKDVEIDEVNEKEKETENNNKNTEKAEAEADNENNNNEEIVNDDETK